MYHVSNMGRITDRLRNTLQEMRIMSLVMFEAVNKIPVNNLSITNSKRSSVLHKWPKITTMWEMMFRNNNKNQHHFGPLKNRLKSRNGFLKVWSNLTILPNNMRRLKVNRVPVKEIMVCHPRFSRMEVMLNNLWSRFSLLNGWSHFWAIETEANSQNIEFYYGI